MKKASMKFMLICMVGGLTSCSWWQPYEDNNTHAPSQAYRMQENNTYSDQTKTISQGVPEPSALTTPVAEGTIGGQISGTMDSMDKMKLVRALDSSPGKATHWENPNTGVNYTVVPIKKLTINQNPYCRAYQVTATKDEKEKQFKGTACVTTDGTWQSVS